MIFNKLTGTGAQEIILVKRATSKIKSLLNNKQDKFANIGEDERLNKVLVPAGEYDVILNDDFKAQTSATTEDSNNIVNVSMLRGYHDSAKQDKLTAGANINISEENVISSTGGETWRDIITYEIPIDETTIDLIRFNEDSQGNSFNLKNVKIFIFAPQDSTLQGGQNGYIDIKDNNNDTHTYGALNYVRPTADNYIFVEFDCFSTDIPTVVKIISENISVNPQNEMVSFGTNSDSAIPFASAKEITFRLNSNYFPVGTKFVIKGVDA